MKYLLFIFSLCVFGRLSIVCDNPMLLPANNDLISSSVGILTDSVTAPADFKFCPRLSGKEICMDDEGLKLYLEAFKAMNKKFKSKRKD